MLEDARSGVTHEPPKRASRHDIEALRMIPGWGEIPEEALRDLMGERG